MKIEETCAKQEILTAVENTTTDPCVKLLAGVVKNLLWDALYSVGPLASGNLGMGAMKQACGNCAPASTSGDFDTSCDNEAQSEGGQQ